jgi:ATP-binding cassette, subfamily B, bacterial
MLFFALPILTGFRRFFHWNLRSGGTRAIEMTKRKVPVVLQLSSVECGAACLAMITGYFGRKTRLEECRAILDPGRDGATGRTIAAAGRQFGLRVRGLSLDLKDLAGVDLPCIVHWNGNHFVVLESWTSGRVEIVDPAWGRRLIMASEFEEAFQGVVLVFEPGPDFELRSDRHPNFLLSRGREILRLHGTKALLARILLASLIMQSFGFALPLLTRWVVDRALPLRTSGALNAIALGAFVIAIMSGLISYLRSILLVRLESRMDSHLMLGFFEHLLSLPYRFFQLRSSGDLLMRLGSNAAIREALASYTTSAILDGSLVLMFLVELTHISALFAAAVLTIALVEVGILAASSQKLHCLTESDLAAQSVSQSCLIESLAGIATLKASGAEEATLTRWSGLLEKQLAASARRNRFDAEVSAAMSAIRVFSPLFLLWLGGTQVSSGMMTLGTMLAVNALASAFLQPVASLVLSAQRLQLAAAHLARIADVMRAEPEQDRTKVSTGRRFTGKIELRDISFRYDINAPKVLENISLTIHRGQKIALVGRTGSGKSTLARLLLGLYQPTEGEILYDGVPLREVDLRTLRSQWGTVLQDSFLLNSSVRENISFHKPDMPASDVVRAAQVAEIHADIVEMPMGYETRVDEGGRSLSGGQRQRLAIARAVAHRPQILLLDEATSHLDMLTEARVDRNLDALSCTRVVIAHRVSTIVNADLILMLCEGAVVEQGSHRELLALDGHYAALVRGQQEAGHSESDSDSLMQLSRRADSRELPTALEPVYR